MNRRWVGFVTAVCCYVVGVAIFIILMVYRDELGDWPMKILPDNVSDVVILMTVVGIVCLPSLVAGIRLLVIRKWYAFQGWLMGLALTVIFSIGVLIHLFS